MLHHVLYDYCVQVRRRNVLRYFIDGLNRVIQNLFQTWRCICGNVLCVHRCLDERLLIGNIVKFIIEFDVKAVLNQGQSRRGWQKGVLVDVEKVHSDRFVWFVKR